MIESETTNQFNFRIILNCMSFPATINTLKCPEEYKQNPLASIYLCAQLLLDPEVSFWVSGEILKEVTQEIVFKTKAYLSTNESADYLFLTTDDVSNKIIQAKKGTMESPEEGATCLIYVPEITHERSSTILKGPGIKTFAQFPILKDFNLVEFTQTFANINNEFPKGIDFIFIDSLHQIFCIPRTVKIERKE
jgi:alpha-D-ribose 1-methylphosphonate 5-triphosphate synthase subunit PhnH